jgi:two-component system cell cycle response regulator DivK
VNGATVLLVDDFEDGLDMYREYLVYRGYHVIVARDGHEAIAQARLHRPDVILLDIRMPGMTGTDAMRALRSDSSFEGVPIVALTAHALDGERLTALEDGFDDPIRETVSARPARTRVGGYPRDVPNGATGRSDDPGDSTAAHRGYR